MKLKKVVKQCISISVVLVCLLTSCASTKAKTAETSPLKWDSSVKMGTLDNGISYYIKKNASPANRITLRLVVKAGSAMEDDDQKGIAHFVEHMAFNGTENFEKSEIVDYFEKIGMNFGSDLNAETTFENTVYKLEIPADDSEILETAMQIMHDWSCAVTFDPEEVEKERGVIVEDWRLRQNLNGRVLEKYGDVLLGNSRFNERFPIGDMDIVKNISRERIVDFYKKWYRPELISVVVAGDIEPAKMEKVITRTMSTIPASEEKIQSPVYDIPVPTEKNITVMKDPEQPYPQVLIFEPVPGWKPRETEEDIMKILIDEIAAETFNLRMNEISTKADSPWIAAGCSDISLTNMSLNNFIAVYPKTGMFEPAIKQFFDEVDKYVTFGITENELNRKLQSKISQVELEYQNKDKIENSVFASRLVTYVKIGKVMISAEDLKNTQLNSLKKITVEMVNEEIREVFGNRGTSMLVIAPQNENLPAETEIMSIWKDYRNTEITAYEDNVSDNDFMAKPARKAKITSKSENKNLGTKEYVLDNGIRILTKKTDFEKNIVYFKIVSEGGKYKVPEEELPSSDVCLNYMVYSGFEGLSYNDFIKKLQTKKVSVSFGVSNTSEYIYGSCKSDDNEAALQIFNLMFDKAKFTEEGWNAVKQIYKSQAEAFGKQPTDHFNRKINEILYGKDNPYFAPFDMNTYNKIDSVSAEKFVRQRFNNPADFTFVFVGDFDEKTLIDNCCYYLGDLKTTDQFEKMEYKYWPFPEGKPEATVTKGIGDFGCVYMGFGGSLPAAVNLEENYKETYIISLMQGLLDIRLREVIREDKSGAYGVRASAYIDGDTERFYGVNIYFGCEPGRQKELSDEVINLIKKLQTEPIDSVYINKLKETCRRNRETNLWENHWWMHRIEAEMIFENEPEWVSKDLDKLQSWITAENLQEAARKYLNTDNYVSVFLEPEKQ